MTWLSGTSRIGVRLKSYGFMSGLRFIGALRKRR
jgi:hypothetical protein